MAAFVLRACYSGLPGQPAADVCGEGSFAAFVFSLPPQVRAIHCGTHAWLGRSRAAPAAAVMFCLYV
jgi:hypothetical protein